MLKVLIVDDSLMIRRQVKIIMEKLGHKVVGEASNASEAVSIHSRFQVDLVTMDITMQGPDGIWATTNILQKDKDTKIIMVTSHDREDTIIDAIKAGAAGYLLKPITEEKVLEAIDKVFGEAESDE